MDNKVLAEIILKAVGGTDNVKGLAHCMTRLRFTLIDNSLVNQDDLKKTEGIAGVQIKAGQLQVIIGPHVDKVYAEFPIFEEAEESKEEPKSGKIGMLINTFSSFFIPVAIGIGGAGLIKGLLALTATMGWIGVESDVYTVLNLISDGVFYFLPFLLAVSVAKKIGVNEYLSLALATMLMSPTLIEGAATGVESLSFFGIPIPMISYSSSVLPIILGVIALKYVFNFLSKFIPKSMELIITSALSLLIVGILMLSVLAPLGTYVGNYVTIFFVWLFEVAGPFAGMLMCGVFPLLVITGMAYSAFPVVFSNFETLGYDFVFMPFMIYANINQGVASLAVGLRTRNSKVRSLALSSGVTAILGITEPAMYSVNLRFKRPFYCIIVGNAVAGLASALLGVKMFGMAGGGITAVPAFSSVDYAGNMGKALISLGLGIVVTFILTFIFTPKEMLDD